MGQKQTFAVQKAMSVLGHSRRKTPPARFTYVPECLVSGDLFGQSRTGPNSATRLVARPKTRKD
jgi:hypothetical protein